MEIKDLITYTKEYPAREAIYSDFPEDMLPELSAYLKKQGISGLYCHQAEMFEKAQEGKNLVITTSTASGKTLSFLLPVLQEILKDPLARAVFIYPTKALAADQYRAIQPVIDYFGENRISAGVYDGDTPASERSRIRKNANLILTNPEMLNGAFLPNHSRYGFDFIFSNLKFVVIDELHTYRGLSALISPMCSGVSGESADITVLPPGSCAARPPSPILWSWRRRYAGRNLPGFPETVHRPGQEDMYFSSLRLLRERMEKITDRFLPRKWRPI